VATDVTSADQVKKLVDHAVQAHGRIDVLINNAGLMPHSPLERGKIADWERMIDVNLKGVLYGIAAALPHMKAQKSGHIINVSSVAGHTVRPGGAVYSANQARGPRDFGGASAGGQALQHPHDGDLAGGVVGRDLLARRDDQADHLHPLGLDQDHPVERLHQVEVRAEDRGVPAPAIVPALYPLGAGGATTKNRISVFGDQTFGEVEFALINSSAGWLVTVASDHTDALVETVSVSRAKRLVVKVGSSLVTADGRELAGRLPRVLPQKSSWRFRSQPACGDP
jgi:hypothetical protein